MIYGHRILTLHSDHLDHHEELDCAKLSKKVKYTKR